MDQVLRILLDTVPVGSQLLYLAPQGLNGVLAQRNSQWKVFGSTTKQLVNYFRHLIGVSRQNSISDSFAHDGRRKTRIGVGGVHRHVDDVGNSGGTKCTWFQDMYLTEHQLRLFVPQNRYPGIP